MATLCAPYFPLIYVRGYAMTPGEVADAVSSPYMGFNEGATRLRQAWDGQVRRQVFESPLVRLMKDYGYRDIYDNGTEIAGPVPARSVVIYRYYDSADHDLGDGQSPSVMAAAQGLRDLLAEWDGTHHWIALSSHKGFQARLRLQLQHVAPDPGVQDAVLVGALPVA